MRKKYAQKPLEKGVAKVPVVMQMEFLECGAACLGMILAYYGKWLPLEQIRRDCGVSRDGSKASNVLKAARSYGMKADGFKSEVEGLKEGGEYPCIIHWNFNHFVVLCGFRGGYAYINDPARGQIKVPMEEFDNSFTGIVLMFEPGSDFVPGGKPKSTLAFAAKRLRGAAAAVWLMVLSSLIGSLFTMIEPGFSRIFIDYLLSGTNPQWFYPFMIFLTVFSVMELIVAWVRVFYSLRLGGKMDVMGSSSFMWKVMGMPQEFFAQRMVGDIRLRMASNATVSKNIINTVAPLFFDTLMMVFYIVVMIRYNPWLAMFGIASSLVHFISSRIIGKKRVNITRVQMRDRGKLSGTTMSGIRMIETIKSSGAENGFFERWAGYQAAVNSADVRVDRMNAYYGLIPSIFQTIADAMVMVVGVWLTMRGEFSLGMIMTFQGFMMSFLSPATSLISAGQIFQEMRTDMERIDDVMEYPVKPQFRQTTKASEKEYQKLSGRIDIKNLSFGYSPLDSPLIRDFSVSVPAGGSVAFVGASGCGKSTLANLISNLYQPWEGEILFDGKRYDEIDRNVFCGSLAMVDQDIILFKDTIANNIRMWDSSIENFEVILAARDAQIHDDIMEREGGYNFKITEDGRDFSGGQRQRLEIARVLASDPTMIILDEATSALDAKTEYQVMQSIRNRGITTIVIAHRLSTIRDCDEIIVLDKGLVVERGTHEELMAKNGLYTTLVTNE